MCVYHCVPVPYAYIGIRLNDSAEGPEGLDNPFPLILNPQTSPIETLV